MNILALTPGLSHTGAPLMLYNLLAALQGECRITLCSLTGEHGPLAEEIRAAGLELSGPDIGGRSFDVCLCNTVLTSRNVVELSRSLPVVWWIHEPASGLNHFLGNAANTAAFAAATRIVFPTRWQAERVYGPWLRRDNWEVVPSAVRPPEDPGPPPFSSSPDRFTLVHLGTVEPRKGQDLTMQAVALLGDAGVHVHFVGALTAQGEALARAVPSGLRERLTFTGPLPPAAAASCLKAADAVVLPTRDDLIPLTVLEAMHYGRPVLTSDFGPIPELVRHGRTGLLSPVDDHRVLAGNIAMLRRDPTLAATLGLQGQAEYRRRPSFSEHAAAMLRVLREAAGR